MGLFIRNNPISFPLKTLIHVYENYLVLSPEIFMAAGGILYFTYRTIANMATD